MRIAIVGVGALGSLLGHAFCRAGRRVTLVDRPERLAAVAASGGLIVEDPEGRRSIAVADASTASTEAAGVHDVVFLATKAHDLPALAGSLSPLLGPESFLVTVQNGIPWWYFQGLEHRLAGRRLRSVDPEGLLERHVDVSRVVGCVAYPAAILRPDGTVKHVEGHRFQVGELDGRERERTRRLVQLLVDAGFKSRVPGHPVGDLVEGPGSALDQPDQRAHPRHDGRHLHVRADARGRGQNDERGPRDRGGVGASFRHTVEERIEGARAVGGHKTSMLQDVENRRPMELDALMASVLELAELTGRRADAIRTVHACAALLNQQIIAAAR